jgi:hypothetical protein
MAGRDLLEKSPKKRVPLAVDRRQALAQEDVGAPVQLGLQGQHLLLGPIL